MTIRDIAKKANVSPATVSLVLNGKGGVGTETRQRILDIVEQEGYVPRPPREAAVPKKTIRLIKLREVGLLIDRNEEFIARVFDGITDEAAAQGYELKVSNMDVRTFEASIPELNSNGDSGIILLATEMGERMESILPKLRLPMVVLDDSMHMQYAAAVTMDNEQAAYLALQHLQQLGHRRVGFISSKFSTSNFAARERGMQLAAKKLGLEYNEAYRFELVPDLDNTPDILDAELLARPDFPTGFFAANDILALITLRLFKHAGKKVPDDISVVGMDDLQISAIASPRLTTVRVFNETMGHTAVTQLVARMANPSGPTLKTFVTCELVVRKSTAPPRGVAPGKQHTREL